jgi:erythromycin esterase-like protein
VAVEADWPDAYWVNRYVRGVSDDANANAALSGFKRFRAWMWRNQVVLDFVQWLREYNDTQSASRKVGFYGIDLYSLFTSIEAVLSYLDIIDPTAAQRARYRYSYFDHFSDNTQAYGYAAAFGMTKTSEDEVVNQLLELTRRAGEYARRDGRGEPDEYFYAQQNARLVKNAEEYYRTMFRGHVSSWNLRDSHMVETLRHSVLTSRTSVHPPASPCGRTIRISAMRARLKMGQAGEWKVGQLMRERYGSDVVLVGFSTHRGTLTAATDWGGTAQRKRVRPGLPGSYEELFHEVAVERFLLRLRDNAQLSAPLKPPRLQRAIGVMPNAPSTNYAKKPIATNSKICRSIKR